MLGKLIKNEFKATYKVFLLLYCSLIILSVLTRVCTELPENNGLFSLLTGLIQIAYCILLIFLSFFSIVILIKRFYNHMLKDEGYLTHTLPVKKWQLLASKLITDVVWTIVSIFVALISLSAFGIGTNAFRIVLKGINDGLKDLGEHPKLIITLILIIILCIVEIAYTINNIFTAMSLGQLVTKHKIAASVMFYFAINYAVGIISGVIIVLMPNLTTKFESIDEAGFNTLSQAEKVSRISGGTNTLCIMMIIMLIILGALQFVVSNYILSKKLNLE